MEAVVLAGGFGTRLRETVPDCPKPMAPVAGRPFLEILLGSLARKGFQRIVLSLGYMAGRVIDHFGEAFAGMSLVYEIEMTPLGTGGALRKAMTRCKTDYAFVFNGDTFLDLEVENVVARWRVAKIPIIVAREVSDTARYGRLETIDGRVAGYSDTGSGGPGLINAGCYLLPTNILDNFALHSVFSLERDFLAQAVGRQHIGVFVTEGYFIDIGVPEDYARAQIELRDVGARLSRSSN